MDLRLAVDEACGIFLAGVGPDRVSGPPADLLCRFSISGRGLSFEVSGRAEGVMEPDTESVGWQILSLLVDALSWHNDGTTAYFALQKHHKPGGLDG